MQKAAISTEWVPTRSPDIVSREVAGELLLVPIPRTASEVKEFYTLNEVGAFIWDRIDGRHPVAEIIAAVVEEFAVEREEAENDLLLLLDELRGIDAIAVS